MKSRIIVACGTGVATSTLVHQRLDAFLKKNNIDADVCQCTYTEIEGNITPETKVIIASSKVADEIEGVPVLVSIPYISGIGIDKFEEKILSYLK
ncbi:PTS sugar transporter subunit IIB [Lactimicrobium sp.]|jgi:PTS system galactitol-specific IIB component|uniref:PTS sugar transporter subunit IIB n=1 Tax=Lactimicrobium sp. TaxID=2563780 RepID=UPI002F3576E3